MKLIIARHGNTFDPKDKVVWVGSRNDLPLVSKGVAQAHNLAKDLKNRELLPSKIFSKLC